MDALLLRRNVENIVKETLNDTPVTVIQGARQVGKSTLAIMVAQDFNYTSVTLDSEITIAAAKENPYEFVSQKKDGLLIIDEIQKYPELLNSVKLSVDKDRRPGRFLITGSANILELRDSNESLAGRAETIFLEPFSVGEMRGIKEDFVSVLMNEDILSSLQKVTPMTRTEYAQFIESGGYPDAQKRISRRRKAYFKNYLSRVLDHDAVELSGLAHIDRLQTIYAFLAGNPAQTYIRANVSRTLGIPESSMNAYIHLLKNLCLLHSLPSWGKNYSKRAVNRPKIILSDTGLVCSVNGITADFLSNIENGNALGPLLEAFVITEIIKQQTWSSVDYTLFHYRDSDNKEVDLLLELKCGKIIAFEIKASSSFSNSDFSGMKLLRNLLGERFHCGILLYTGSDVLPFGEKLYAAPISTIWQS
jgi:predicted AAA+ superfamily ATPase